MFTTANAKTKSKAGKTATATTAKLKSKAGKTGSAAKATTTAKTSTQKGKNPTGLRGGTATGGARKTGAA